MPRVGVKEVGVQLEELSQEQQREVGRVVDKMRAAGLDATIDDVMRMFDTPHRGQVERANKAALKAILDRNPTFTVTPSLRPGPVHHSKMPGRNRFERRRAAALARRCQ